MLLNSLRSNFLRESPAPLSPSSDLPDGEGTQSTDDVIQGETIATLQSAPSGAEAPAEGKL